MADISWNYRDDSLDNNALETRGTLEQSVAEQLASLSEAEFAPTDFKPCRQPFSASDVRFVDGSWIARLLQVQGWLHFPTELRLNDLLFRQLGDLLDLPLDSLTPEAPLSIEALKRLDDRLATALQAAQDFNESLGAEGGTVQSATVAWTESWERSEDDAIDETAPEPVIARADVWNIRYFVDLANDKSLDLAPSYQRGDVWPTKDSQMLMESILRGIPLPSIIMLKPSNNASAPSQVVDGKQRLTAILRFIGKHPKALEIVRKLDSERPGHNLVDLFQSDYPKFKTAWRNLKREPLTAERERENYFPFRLRSGVRELRGPLQHLQGRYYSEIRSMTVDIMGQEWFVSRLFEGPSEYKIPIIEYSRATQRQIYEVFNLYNKQGKHLNAEEIRNAMYHDLDLTRAILMAAGDAPGSELASLAPALTPVWPMVSQLAQTLKDYNFGTARYRRSKVLSWILANLLLDTRDSHRKPVLLSTAGQIDTLLKRIEEDPAHRLRNTQVISQALRLVAIGAEAHSAYENAWHPRFRDAGTGGKWQELQLVGSLTGVIAASVVDPGGIGDRMHQATPRLREASQGWVRPTKTQTQQQWTYIAKIARGVVEILDVEVEQVSTALVQTFGASGLETLWAVPGWEKG